MKRWLAVIIFFCTVTFFACSKDSNKGTRVNVRMADQPIAAQEVNIDLQQVRVQFNDDTINGWIDLSTHAGIYNLLGLQNGVDTLIATGGIPTNTLNEIRLVLGSNNTITVAGITYPLTIPSGEESGLKIKVNHQLHGILDSLLIDFDAGLSIHQTGNYTYILKPVLRVE